MKNTLLMILSGLIVVACASPRAVNEVAEYGLSLPRAGGHSALRTVQVTGASWLQSRDMVYRRDFAEPGRRFSYSASRWQASPVEMLERYLAHALLAENVKPVGLCRLQVDLQRFDQEFPDSQHSRGVLVVRLQLHGAQALVNTPAVARHTLEIIQAAPSANAQGGVTALNQAAAQLAQDISSWASQASIASLCAAGNSGQ